jgi:glycosyltransferase involved in cell wall biosynthesis
MNKLTLSVGISAYNEEANIANVITSFLYQQESNYELKEIIVISDGSSDKTVELVKGFGDDRVHLVAHTDRDGKAKRLNEIISLFSGDILLLTDADVLPDDQTVFEKIINKFQEDLSVDMVLANVRPLPAVTFFESAINNFFYAREDQVKHFDFLSSIHGARGAGIALSKKVAKQIVFPESLIIDDAFTYLFIKEHDFKVVAVSDAVIWFRSVQTVADFKKQIMRYMKGDQQMHKFYSDNLIQNTSFVPSKVMLRVLFNQINRDVIGYIYLKIVFIYCRFYLKYYHYRTSPKWLISKSSKLLQVQTETAAERSPIFSKLWKTLGVLKGVLILWLNN